MNRGSKKWSIGISRRWTATCLGTEWSEPAGFHPPQRLGRFGTSGACFRIAPQKLKIRLRGLGSAQPTAVGFVSYRPGFMENKKRIRYNCLVSRYKPSELA